MTPRKSLGLPQALDSEKAVLAAMLVNAMDLDIWGVVLDLVDVQFALERHKKLYGRMVAMYQRAREQGHGEPFDMLTLAQSFRDDGDLEGVGGIAYLSELIALDPCSIPLLRDHVRHVQEASDRRGLIQACMETVESMQEGGGMDGHAAAMGRARKALSDATVPSGGDGDVLWLSGAIRNAWGQIDRQVDPATPMPTGLAWLDRRAEMTPGMLLVLGGRPSMGKTAAMLQIAQGWAKAGYIGLLDSREMSPAQLTIRMMSAEAGCDCKALMDPRKTELMRRDVWDEQVARAARAATTLDRLPIAFLTGPPRTVDGVARVARAMKRRNGLDFLMIDYLQIMKVDGDRSRESTWAGVTAALKQLAMELEIVVVLLSQLSRGIESRDNKRPMMSDLKYSGAIEADADAICLLYREVYYTAKREGKDEDQYPDAIRRGASWEWPKVREGRPGSDRVLWFGERQRFEMPSSREEW